MGIEVKFPLDNEEPGGKWFLSHLFIEKEDDGTISIGLTKRNGDAYAWANITEQQLLGALTLLGLIEEE